MKKIIALVLAVGVIVGLVTLGVKYKGELFTEKREVTYIEVNDEVIVDNR